jgi:hypothetical protein
MRTIWRIQENIRNQGNGFHDWLGTTLEQCYYTPDQDSYLLYRGWSIAPLMKFSQVPVSHDDFPHRISLSSWILSSPKNTKLSHCSQSLQAMFKSLDRVQYTLSTAYTAYCIIPRSTVFHSQPISHLSVHPVCTQFCTFPQVQVNQWI